MKTPLHRSHDEATINSFRKDPQFAAEYLNAILEDGDQQELLTALRYLAAAFGGVPYLAEQAELNATTLYRTLSPRGNPELKSWLRSPYRPLVAPEHDSGVLERPVLQG